MTDTHTFARITKDTKKTVEDNLVRVERKITESDAYYLDEGVYKVDTISGEVEVQGPTWILFDARHYPYPVALDIFEAIYTIKD